MKHLKTVLLSLLLATTISLTPQIKKKQGNVIPHKSANDFFTSGVKKYDDGRYEAAIIDFNKAIRLDSKNTTYFSYRGYAKHNLELSDDDQAIKDFDQAISLNPFNHEAYVGRGLVKCDSENYIDGIKDYNEAIDLLKLSDKENPSYYNFRGCAKRSLKQYTEAISDFEMAISLDANCDIAFKELGDTKSLMGQSDEAIEYYTKAQKLNPRYLWLLKLGGKKHSWLKEYDVAIKYYNQVIEFEPKKPGNYYARGTAKFNLEKYEAAIEDYDSAIRIGIDSSCLDAYGLRGIAKKRCNKYEDAIKDFDRAIKLNSKEQGYFFHRGDSKNCLWQSEEAIKDFDVAIVLNPKYYNAHYWKAISLYRIGKLDDAIKTFEFVETIGPNDKSGLYYWFGKCYVKQNNTTKANEYFNKILKNDTVTFYSSYAKLFLGQKDQAIAEMEDIVKKSNDVDDYVSLAMIYSTAGETDKAIKSVDFALKKGYNEYIKLQKHEGLELIRFKSEFIALLEKYDIPNTNPNIPLSKIITNEVKLAMLKWQEKGEFETTQAYLDRMNLKDNEVTKETLLATNRLKSEFLSKIDWHNAQIGKYDPDGQTFLYTILGLKGILINVPLAVAPAFKKSFRYYKIPTKDIVIHNDEWMISNLVFENEFGERICEYDINKSRQ